MADKTPVEGTSPAAGGEGIKVCCVCGKDVSHSKRMKDAAGLYWCSRCAEADHLKKSEPQRFAAGARVEHQRMARKQAVKMVLGLIGVIAAMVLLFMLTRG